MKEGYYENCTVIQSPVSPTLKTRHGMLLCFPLRSKAGEPAIWEETRRLQRHLKEGNLSGLGYEPEEIEFLQNYTLPWWKVTRPNVSHNGTRMSESLEQYYARVAETPDATLNYTKFCKDYLGTIEMNVTVGENFNIVTPRATSRSQYLYDSEGSGGEEKELYDGDIDAADLLLERSVNDPDVGLADQLDAESTSVDEEWGGSENEVTEEYDDCGQEGDSNEDDGW